MVLANYRNYQKEFQNSSDFWTYDHAHTCTFKDLNGDYLTNIMYATNATNQVQGFVPPVIMNRTSKYGLYAVVGNGEGEVAANDYSLFNDITNQFTGLTHSLAAYVDGNIFKTVSIIGGTNTTSNNITITEIGVTKAFYGMNGYSYEEKGRSLFAKKMLDEPVIVPRGEAFTIVFEWLEQ